MFYPDYSDCSKRVVTPDGDGTTPKKSKSGDTTIQIPDGVNAVYDNNIRSTIDTCLKVPPFTDLASEQAVGIAAGGWKSVFNQSELQKAMANHGRYEAACNIMLLNPFWSFDGHAVPRIMGKTHRLAKAIIPDRNNPQLNTSIVVLMSRPDTNVYSNMGQMKCLSPIEDNPLHSSKSTLTNHCMHLTFRYTVADSRYPHMLSAFIASHWFTHILVDKFLCCVANSFPGHFEIYRLIDTLIHSYIDRLIDIEIDRDRDS